MATAVTVNIRFAPAGEYHFQHQLGPQPEPLDPNGNGHGRPVEGGRVIPQTSSVIAPGFARRMPA